MDPLLYGVTLLILLRAAHEKFPPVCVLWSFLSTEELWDVHYILALKWHGDAGAETTLLQWNECIIDEPSPGFVGSQGNLVSLCERTLEASASESSSTRWMVAEAATWNNAAELFWLRVGWTLGLSMWNDVAKFAGIWAAHWAAFDCRTQNSWTSTLRDSCFWVRF